MSFSLPLTSCLFLTVDPRWTLMKAARLVALWSVRSSAPCWTKVRALLNPAISMSSSTASVIPCPTVRIFSLTEKRLYNSLPHLLTKVAETEMMRLPPNLNEYSVTYIPQVDEKMPACCSWLLLWTLRSEFVMHSLYSWVSCWQCRWMRLENMRLIWRRRGWSSWSV